MLRASAEATHQPYDLRGVTDPMVDPLLPYGCELRALTDAAVLRDPYERDIALENLIDVAGADAARRAAATAGNFEMMNRLLDGIGVGPNDHMVGLASDLGIAWPPR